MLSDKINFQEFRLFGEIPLLLKLRLKKVFGKTVDNVDGILVIDVCIIGDFLATLPALRTFIEQQRQDVDLIVSPPLKSLAEGIRGVRKVFTARSVYQRSNEIQEGSEAIPSTYGQVMVLRISPEAYRCLKQIKYSNIRIYDVPYFRYYGHVFKNIQLKRDFKQWSDVNFEMVGIKKPDRAVGFDDIFRFNESDYDHVKKMPEMAGGRKKVIIHTGSGWSVKLWDNDKWADVIRKINASGNYEFIVIGRSELEEESFKAIQNQLDFKIYSMINKIDLKTTLLMMRLSNFFIGVDSGPRNMAHLADLRSITMLGPAPRNFMPQNKNDIVIDKFTCRCKSLFYLHKVSAIHQISADEVYNGFIKLSKTSQSPVGICQE